MRSTIILRAQQARKPMIKFLGKRSIPKQVDHTPHAHPASPTHSLPDSFASYRGRAQQHGPMGGKQNSSSQSSQSSQAPPVPPSSSIATTQPYGVIGGTPANRLGSIKPKDGEFFDRSELPKRFAGLPWSDEEMDAITSAGASLYK